MPVKYSAASARCCAIAVILCAPFAYAQSPAGDDGIIAISAGSSDATLSAVEVFVDASEVKGEFETVFSADPNQETMADEAKRIMLAREMAVSAGADAVIVGAANRAPEMGPKFRGLQKRLQPGSVVGIKYSVAETSKKGKKEKKEKSNR